MQGAHRARRRRLRLQYHGGGAATPPRSGVGPYEVPHVAIDAYGAHTNNPPCGAMRGFGAVQACFGYESQMDALAAALGLDPVEIRVRNAVSTGDTHADRPGGRLAGPARGDAAPGRVRARAETSQCRPAPAARRGGQHHPRRGRRARRRLRRRHQEHLLLGGLRRLLDRTGTAASRRRIAGGRRAHRRRRGRPGTGHAAGADRPDRARRCSR